MNATEMIADIPIGVSPTYIVINGKSGAVYVTDTVMNSVFKFEQGNGTGQLVASDSLSDSIVNQLALPMGLTLDSAGYLYIADGEHNRIVQVLNDQGGLRTIAGKIVFLQIQGISLQLCHTSLLLSRHRISGSKSNTNQHADCSSI